MGNCICNQEEEVDEQKINRNEQKSPVEVIPNITKKMSNHYTIHYPPSW